MLLSDDIQFTRKLSTGVPEKKASLAHQMPKSTQESRLFLKFLRFQIRLFSVLKKSA
jgi:hypothetical protein